MVSEVVLWPPPSCTIHTKTLRLVCVILHQETAYEIPEEKWVSGSAADEVSPSGSLTLWAEHTLIRSSGGSVPVSLGVYGMVAAGSGF